MLLNLFFPRRCVSCNKIGKYICDSCRKLIKYIEFPFCPVCRYLSVNGMTHARCSGNLTLDGVYAGAHYSGPVKKAIRLVKYRFVSDLLAELTEILMLKLPLFLRDFDFLVPIPLHKKRLKERGFNQSLLISKLISKNLRVPVKNEIVYRQVYTKPQFGLKPKERNINVKNVFHLNNYESVKNKKICLVDDVATTFSTLNECAKIFKKNDASKVWAIVLAHGN